MNQDQNRRSFLKEIAALGGAAAVMSYARPAWASAANPLDMPIGCQTYPVRQMIAADHIGTFRQLSEAGFRRIELCSPVNYAAAGFGVLAKYSGPQLRQILIDQGLKTESSHFGVRELREQISARIEWAREVGITQMIVPSLNGPQNPTMDDVKRAADEFSRFGEEMSRSGIQGAIHNEGFELSMVDGRRTYDVLLELTDPRYVKFQFQLSTISRGYDAAEYFTKYPGRFVSMHLQDWDPVAKTTVPVGKGSLDWKKIFTAAKIGGVKNYFVEMNLEFMKASVPYLHSLQV